MKGEIADIHFYNRDFLVSEVLTLHSYICDNKYFVSPINYAVMFNVKILIFIFYNNNNKGKERYYLFEGS